MFPQCLAFLDALLHYPKFAKELAIPAFAEHLHRQQGLHWMYDARLTTEVHTDEGNRKAINLLNVDSETISSLRDDHGASSHTEIT